MIQEPLALRWITSGPSATPQPVESVASGPIGTTHRLLAATVPYRPRPDPCRCRKGSGAGDFDDVDGVSALFRRLRRVRSGLSRSP